ncbi:hypothetical protein FQN50_008229 [Emmonsiellopsis sp. PD_5]|nr:hypothetical protein FQN50_008229 [Emmonsiellopsis sp. PD_5]
MEFVDTTTTIATLTPCTDSAFAVLKLEHNKRRVVGTGPTLQPQPGSRRKRQRTPAVTAATGEHLILSLLDEHKPIDPLQGFVFGSDANRCDVLLTGNGSNDGISRVHFRIDYHGEPRALLITDESTRGTRIQSKAAGTSILLEKKTLPIVSGDQIQAGLALFTLSIPDRGNSKQIFHDNWMRYYEERQKALPYIGALSIQQPNAVTYLDVYKLSLLETLGSGSCGTVHKAIDGAGIYYAVKVLKPLTDGANDVELKGSLAKEIEVLCGVKHDHLVCMTKDKYLEGFSGFFLVMEYIQMGTLEQLEDLTPQDVTLMACQILSATLHLHTEGHIHRDIKPANILVKSIEPFVFVLSDFGFTCRDNRKTSIGSQLYAAPEIHLGQQYWTDAVDIWSIGVVILQYTSGLPLPPTQWDHNAWLEALAAVVPAPDPFGGALGQLAQAMLDHDPDGRPNAQFCLTKAKMILKGGWTGTSLGKRAQNKHPIIPSSPLFDDISSVDLRRWVLRDNHRQPSTAINLTRICWALSLSRNEMRSYIKKEGHAFYVIHASKNQGQHTYKGTYVSIPCAIAFVRKCRPDLKEVLSDLEDLGSSSKGQSPNQGLTVSSNASRVASSPNLIPPLQGQGDMMQPNVLLASFTPIPQTQGQGGSMDPPVVPSSSSNLVSNQQNDDNLGFSPSNMLPADWNLEPFATMTEEELANFIGINPFPDAPGEGN